MSNEIINNKINKTLTYKFQSEKIEVPFVLLKDIAEINKGINLKKYFEEGFSRTALENKFGTKKNDIIIKRDFFSKGKKLAFVIKELSENIILGTSCLLIRPDVSIVCPVYVKAFLESTPSEKVLRQLEIKNKKKLLSKGSLSKMVIPLLPLEKQIEMTEKYEEIKSGELGETYCDPFWIQYRSLMKFFWSCYN